MPYKDTENKRKSDKRYYERHHEQKLAWQRDYNRKYYAQNRKRILENRQKRMRLDEQFHEKQKKSSRASYRKAADRWGIKKNFRPTQADEGAIRAELFVAQIILPKHGFSDIIICRTFSKQFPVDILAKRNGRRIAIEVTTSMHKTISPEKKLLVDFMEAEFYVCHVKPDFSQYFLFPLNLAEKRTTCCTGMFMETETQIQGG